MSFFTAAVAIVAIIAATVLKLAKQRPQQTPDDPVVTELVATVASMRERIEVLEKIVTDSNYDLKQEFRNL
jgi:anti-sigma-K factor RskA